MFSFGKKGSAARNASAAAADLNSVESDVISELGLSSDPVTSPMARNRKTVLYRGGSSRKNLGDPHVNIKALGESRLGHLVSRRRARQRYMNKLMQKGTLKEQQQGEEEAKTPDDSEVISRPSKFDASARITSASSSTYSVEELTEDEKEQMKQTSEGLMLIKNVHKNYASLMSEIPIEIRMSNFTFVAPFTEASSKIKTVYNSSFVYQVVKLFKRLREGTLGAPKEEVHNQIVLDKINLSLKPGKMYLLLGPPASGKSSLLKAIAGRLRHSKKNGVSGVVTYNGKSFADKTEIHIDNAISMIDQLDRHAPRYTVEETFNFAFQCKRHNGHHVDFRFTPDTPENRKAGKAADDENLVVDTTIKALGLDHVRNTFVGNEEIRGVSGGQRRRVTIGEMLVGTAPILCGDEISNGLDATSTFDIMNILMHTGKIRRKLQVISLLQPSPETVSLFDEIILLGEGKILFAGPISQVEDYFAALGYVAPVHMDVCDFLQIVATPNGSELYDPSPELAAMRSSPYTLDELAAEFQKSRFGQNIRSEIGTAHRQVFGSAHGDLSKVEDAEYLDDRHFQEKFANSFPRSMWLNLKRQLTLWRRDKRVLIANAVKNIIMGISVGGVFFQTDDVVSILGVLFQGMLFVMLGGMVSAPAFVDERLVYYKQTDANFFGAFSFVIAKATSKVPQVSHCTESSNNEVVLGPLLIHLSISF
jgi:ABC-type multidrug transport system ATPase subunit